MTNQEIIDGLRFTADMFEIDTFTGEKAYLNEDSQKSVDACRDAIKILEQEPCEDAVSRASVCELIADLYGFDNEKVVAISKVDELGDKIRALPSVQPQTVDEVGEAEIEYTS